MVKINLEDLIHESSFPCSLQEDGIKTLVYTNLKSIIKGLDINSYIIELLMSIRENKLNSIEAILKYELEQLKNSSKSDDLIYLTKINTFFKESNLDNIIIFSSLKKDLTEIKASSYFIDEISMLDTLLTNLSQSYIDYYDDITENDDNFNEISNNTSFLQGISNTVKTFATRNLKKIASDNFQKNNIDDQISVLMKLMYKNIQTPNISHQISYKKTNDDEIEEAEILDGDKLAETSNTLSKDILNDIVELKENINNLKVENEALKNKLDNFLLANQNLINMLESFLNSQLKLQNRLKEKYSIDF